VPHRLVGVLAVLVLAPATVAADGGAVTLEAAPLLTVFPSMPPLAGHGPSITGTAGGGLLGVRYAVRNDLELSAAGFYEASATYTHPGVSLASAGGTFPGSLTGSSGRYGALIGARMVWGLRWRLHVGAEVGWAHQEIQKLDLINVSDPSNPHSYGLGLADRSRDALILAPLAGVEWQVSDHWSVTVVPRLQVMLGGAGRVAVMVPLSVVWSWYAF
jgi:hypothetical protein